MNRKTRAAGTAALFGVVLLLDGCANSSWLRFGDTTVQERIARHEGPWVVEFSFPPDGVNIPENSRVLLTTRDICFEGCIERIPLVVVKPELGGPPEEGAATYGRAYVSQYAGDLQRSAALLAAPHGDPDLATCRNAVRTKAPEANMVAAHASRCMIVTLRAHPSNLERDQLRIKWINPEGSTPVEGGIVVGGPRPSLRYPIVYADKTEPRSGR